MSERERERNIKKESVIAAPPLFGINSLVAPGEPEKQRPKRGHESHGGAREGPGENLGRARRCPRNVRSGPGEPPSLFEKDRKELGKGEVGAMAPFARPLLLLS